jgi:uncharacterized membrane protein YphA (DoxX/SURF4 family)
VNIALWIIQVLLAAMFVYAGVLKAFQYERAKASLFWVKDLPRGLVRFIGLSELLGGLGLLLPAMSGILPWLTPLAGAGLTLIMILAIGFHASRREGQAIAINSVLLVLAAFVTYGRLLIVPL